MQNYRSRKRRTYTDEIRRDDRLGSNNNIYVDPLEIRTIIVANLKNIDLRRS